MFLKRLIKFMKSFTRIFIDKYKMAVLTTFVLETIGNIFLWILLLPVGVVTLPILLVVIILRSLESLIYRKRFGLSMVPMTDVLWSFYNVNNQPYINGLITIDGMISVDDLRKRFKEILDTEAYVKSYDNDGAEKSNSDIKGNNEFHMTKKYFNTKRLKCYVVEGFFNWYWKNDDRFQIDNHILSSNEDVIIKQDELYNRVGSIISQEVPRKLERSPWQIFVVHFEDEESRINTACVFKLSHHVGDGVSLAYFLISQLSDTHTIEIPMKKFSQTQYKMLQFKGVLGFPLASLRLLLVNRDNNLFHLQNIQGLKETFWTTYPISLKDVTFVKNKLNCSVNDVLLGLLSTAIKRYFRNLKGEERARFQTLFPVDVRSSIDHLTDLKNRFATLVVELVAPSTDRRIDAQENILQNKVIFDNIKYSGQPSSIQMSWKLISYILPSWFVKHFVYYTVDKTSAATSNLMGPQNEITIFNKPIKNLTFWAPSTSKQSLSFSFCSYHRTICFAVLKDRALDLDLKSFVDIYKHSLAELVEKLKSKESNIPSFDNPAMII